MEGIKAYNAEQHSYVQAEGINYLSGMENGSLSANTETAYQTDFVNGILELSEGRHITAEDKGAVLVSDKLAEENNLGVGSELILKSATDGKQEEALVVGIYSSDSKWNMTMIPSFSTHDIFWKLSGQGRKQPLMRET